MDFVTNIEEIRKRAAGIVKKAQSPRGMLDRKQAISIPLFHGDRHQLVGGCRRIYGACSAGTGP